MTLFPHELELLQGPRVVRVPMRMALSSVMACAILGLSIRR